MKMASTYGKQEYTSPTMEISEFETEDAITNSIDNDVVWNDLWS